MARKEQELTAFILLEAAKTRTALFRNNVGLGWAGRLISNQQGRVMLHDAFPLRAGLCTGSSDLIGWHPVTITPEMVGKKVAIFTAVEVKTKGVKLTAQQELFLRRVNQAGGIGIEARSVEDILERLK